MTNPQKSGYWADLKKAFHDMMTEYPAYLAAKAKALEPTPPVVPFEPKVAPFGYGVTPEMVQEVWDAFVVPDQEKDMPQSGEMRVLMAILRAAYVSVGGK